ncbi:carboxypeptidase regulatory-like domain-containing protein [bacterium]|nr:carboxypeptidase regulatory-like domain-containing protein [bacterium]
MSVSKQLCVLAAAVTLAGCGGGPDVGSVSGVVTLDGKPLSEASILFTPVEGGRASAATSDAQGNYQLQYTQAIDGALIGEHIVTIATGGEYYDKDGNEHEREELVPDFYNNSREYKQTVAAGSNTIDLKLSSGQSSGSSESEEANSYDGVE